MIRLRFAGCSSFDSGEFSISKKKYEMDGDVC